MRKFNDPVTRPALYAISSKTPHGNTEKIYSLISTPAAAAGQHKRKTARRTSRYPRTGPCSREAACLDTIADICRHSRHATVKDIAKQLGITTTSTTTLLCSLEEKHLINYQRYKGATLTPEGTAAAAENLALRTSLCDLLTMAGVPPDTARNDAETLSRELSETTLKTLSNWIRELKNQATHGKKTARKTQPEKTRKTQP